MATAKKPDEDTEETTDEAPAPAKPKTLVEKAEALLVPPAAGYNSHDGDYNRGVQAVIDLLKAEKK